MRSQYWCFTLNNPPEPYDVLPIQLTNILSYAIWQCERGDAGTLHLQGYMECLKRATLGSLRTLLPRAHFEPRRGTRAQARDYACKEETRVSGPYQFGIEPPPSKQGKRTDLDTLAEALYAGADIETIRNDFPGHSLRYARAIMDVTRERTRQRWSTVYRRGLRVYILWGESGCGKTRSVYERFGIDQVYTLNTASSGALWFDGYEEQPVLLIDDFRGWIKFCEILKICDIYPYRCPIKGAFTWAAWNTVVFTSNHAPSTWWREESEHFFPAFLRRVHRTIHFSTDHPWSDASVVELFDETDSEQDAERDASLPSENE